MIDDATEPPGGNAPDPLEHRRAGQEDHASVCKSRLATFGHIAQQCVACGADMIVDRVAGDRDVLYPACSTAGLGKIDRLAFPEHVLLAALYLIDIRHHCLIIPDRHGLPETCMVRNIG